mmetsp:Transcript_80316/g.217532  ORF Transcript_80316/g.217532 Transcript_80316/m.217532 type:complete len:284 (-) Transcript_80316:375-1226(-)
MPSRPRTLRSRSWSQLCRRSQPLPLRKRPSWRRRHRLRGRGRPGQHQRLHGLLPLRPRGGRPGPAGRRGWALERGAVAPAPARGLHPRDAGGRARVPAQRAAADRGRGAPGARPGPAASRRHGLRHGLVLIGRARAQRRLDRLPQPPLRRPAGVAVPVHQQGLLRVQLLLRELPGPVFGHHGGDGQRGGSTTPLHGARTVGQEERLEVRAVRGGGASTEADHDILCPEFLGAAPETLPLRDSREGHKAGGVRRRAQPPPLPMRRFAGGCGAAHVRLAGGCRAP